MAGNVIENPRDPAARAAAVYTALTQMRLMREAPGIKAHPVTVDFVLEELSTQLPAAQDWLTVAELMVRELPTGNAFRFPGFIIRLAQ